jgi:hypothetical protein
MSAHRKVTTSWSLMGPEVEVGLTLSFRDYVGLLVDHHIQPGLPSLSVLWGQQPSMRPACGLVGPGIYPASSGDPGECRDEEAIDEA